MQRTDCKIFMKYKTVCHILLFAGIVLLSYCGIAYYLGNSSGVGLIVVIALISLAIAFRGFLRLRGFSYTILIFAAVALAMFYPAYFVNVGSFQLKSVIVPFVQLTMFGMGAHMSYSDFKAVIRMPKGVIVGICCHYIIMPLVGFTLSKLFAFRQEVAGGIVLIGCVPSAMASNVMSYLAKANLALAVTIGACSTVVSPFVTPFMMKLLGGHYVKVDVIKMMVDITEMIIIPIVAGFIFNLFYFGNTLKRAKVLQLIGFALIIVITNFILFVHSGATWNEFYSSIVASVFWFYLVPMAAAIMFSKIRKITGFNIKQALSLVAMLGIVVNTVIITTSGRDNLLQVGGLLIIVCLLHNVAGFGIGYTIAKLLGLCESDRRTIAFEVGMQNGGVATGLAFQMGKVATLGLASTIFGPLQNITGSALANWFKNRIPTISQENVAAGDTLKEITT